MAERGPPLLRTLAFLGVVVYLQPVALFWLFLGAATPFQLTQLGILGIGYVIAYRWGVRRTGQRIKRALEGVVATPP